MNPSTLRLGRFLLSALVVLASGCAAPSARQGPRSWDRPAECADLLHRLDRVVGETGVGDAASARVPGFPYLRTDRFLAGLGERLKEEAEKREWVRWMQELDLRARRKEIENLPPAAFLSLGGKEGTREERDELLSRVAACSSRLRDHDLGREDFFAALDALPPVPDEYSSLLRALGLYPLAAVPVAIVTGHVQRKAARWFSGDLEKLSLEGDRKSVV